MVLEQRIEPLGRLAFISLAIDVLYGLSSSYAIALFGSYVAALWIVVQLGSARGLVVAAAGCIGVALGIAPDLISVPPVGHETILRCCSIGIRRRIYSFIGMFF
jgi:hypothetical protein